MIYNKWFQAALDALNVEFPNEEAENITQLQQDFYSDVVTEAKFLLSILTGDVRHVYNGKCPDETNRSAQYDPGCPVCQMTQDLYARLADETLDSDE